jgi:hypothetical protein
MTVESNTPVPGKGDGREKSAHSGQTAHSETSTPVAMLKPCADTMRDHIMMLASAYEGCDGLLELAWDTHAGDGRAKLNRARLFRPSQVDALFKCATRENRAGHNVYISPALRRPDAPLDARTTDADVIASRWVWADFDDEGALDAALQAFEAKGADANWVTLTGEIPCQRGQCWWQVDDDAPLEELRDLQKVIADCFNGDPSVQNIGRVMRLAGTVAWPRKPGRIPELTRAPHDRTRHDSSTFIALRARLAPEPSKVRKRWADAALASAVERARSAPVGTRHDTLFKEGAAIGEIVAGGHLNADEANTALADAARHAGLKDDEISDVLGAAIKRTASKPRGPAILHADRPADDIAKEPEPLIPPVHAEEPWPLDALGDVLADAAKTICGAVQCPEGLAGPSVLTAAATAVQGHHDMMHPLGHAAPCSLALLTLGDSGARKSTADKIALEAYHEAAKDREKEYRQQYVDFRALQEAREAKKSHIKSHRKDQDARTAEDIAAALASLGPDPFPPLPPSRIVTDPNFEGMIKWMGGAHGSVAWLNNEAGASVGGTAFADENRLKFGAGLSRLWDGQPDERVRAGDGHHRLLGRRFTCHLMMQGEIARPFLADPRLRAQGWLSRALICEPPSLIGYRPFREPPDLRSALAQYRAKLRALIEKPCPVADKDGPPNVLAPVPILWDPAARSLWISFHDEIEISLRFDGEMAEHRGFGAKCAENVGRIATVLAAFAGAKTVAVSHMSQAITIVGYYVDETLRHREVAAVSEDIALAEKVRGWLMRWPRATLSVRDIVRLGPNPVRDSKIAKRCAAILREYGWLVGPVNGPWEIRGRG